MHHVDDFYHQLLQGVSSHKRGIQQRSTYVLITEQKTEMTLFNPSFSVHNPSILIVIGKNSLHLKVFSLLAPPPSFSDYSQNLTKKSSFELKQ